MSTVIRIDSLKEDITFNEDLCIDNNFLLLPVTVPVTTELISALKEWQFDSFQCEGDISLGGDIGLSKKEEDFSLDDVENDHRNIKEKINTTVKQALEEAKTQKSANTEKSRLVSVQKVYNEYMNYINSVYTHYATHKKISMEELSDTVKDLCVFIRENKRYVLRIMPSAEARSKNFLVIHSMRSTVLAITIGLELHIPLSKLIELGVTCILHEIGMIRLPPQLYMTDKPLSSIERAHISTHPLIGFNIIKSLNFPLSIQLGVLEHHEKENGTGYPRKLSGDKISTYAKIISVACSFEAITAPRQYKAERTTFDAMVEMLKNENNQYNGIVIKALLYSLSLFPIGAYVYLKNGKIGIVTDVNPNNPKNPIVQLINEKEADGSPKAIQTDDLENKIIRVLNKKEQEDIVNSLKTVEKTDTSTEQASSDANKTAAQANANQTTEKPAQTKTEPKPAPKSEDGFDSVDLSEFS